MLAILLSMTDARPPTFLGYRYGTLAMVQKEGKVGGGDYMKHPLVLNNLYIFLEKYDLPMLMLLPQVDVLFVYFFCYKSSYQCNMTNKKKNYTIPYTISPSSFID